jgi:hypothetical protein
VAESEGESDWEGEAEGQPEGEADPVALPCTTTADITEVCPLKPSVGAMASVRGCLESQESPANTPEPLLESNTLRAEKLEGLMEKSESSAPHAREPDLSTASKPALLPQPALDVETRPITKGAAAPEDRYTRTPDAVTESAEPPSAGRMASAKRTTHIATSLSRK